MNTWVVLDFFGIVSGITACLYSPWNLMNSEIIGKVTDVPWAFIFYNVDDKPRHPGQLYEAIAYLIIFLLFISYIESIRESGYRTLFWTLSYTYLHLPFLHWIHEGDTGSLWVRSANRYGTDIKYSSYCPRCMVNLTLKRERRKTTITRFRLRITLIARIFIGLGIFVQFVYE